MLLYLTQKDQSQELIDEFKKAVLYLPRTMIYSMVDSEGDKINHYLHLFMLGSSNFQPG